MRLTETLQTHFAKGLTSKKELGRLLKEGSMVSSLTTGGLENGAKRTRRDGAAAFGIFGAPSIRIDALE